MIKKVTCIVITVLMAFVLVACSDSGETATETASDETTETVSDETTELASAEATEYQGEEMELNFSSPGTSEDIPGEGMKLMKEYIEEATGGKVTVNLHFQSSLFAQDQEVPAVMKGNLDMCDTDAQWLSDYIPEMSMFASAYLFESIEHWENFFDSDIADEMFDNIVETLGIRVIGVRYNGSRTINLCEDKEVLSRADLTNVKLRMANTEAWIFMGDALGANPVPIAYADLYLALQAGTADGQDNPLPAIKSQSFYEVTESVTLTRHVIQATFMVINDDIWQSMSEELQQIVSEGANIASEYVTETTLSQEDELVEWLEEQGVTVYQPTTEELASYRQEVIDYYLADEDAIADWDMDIYQAIQDLAN